jgi:hypothetical protein
MDETVFSEHKNDNSVVYKGHLWVRELFLLAQYHSPTIAPVLFLLALLMASSFVILDKVWEANFEKNNGLEEKPSSAEYWTYHVLLILGNFVYFSMNLLFLQFARIDISRRNYQMKLLSSALEVNFQ